VPLIVGSEVFVGAPVAAATALVGVDTAVVDPFLLEAVTAKRNLKPTSALTGEYVAAVAALMALQFAPLESQRCHW
jgi:hypothetical protein